MGKRNSRLIALLLAGATLLSLASCGKGKSAETGATEATTFADFDLVSTAKEPTFDYYHEDLTPYLTVAAEDYRGLTVSLDATAEDVETYITDVLLPNYRTPIKRGDRAIEEGDTAYIYYTGYLDGVAFEGGSNASDSEPYPLVIGSGSFIPGFEQGLIGVIPDNTSRENTVDVSATFPESYGNETLNGKTAVFKVWCEGVLDGYEIPEMTAAFVTDTLGFETEETDPDTIVADFKEELLGEIRADIVENLDGEKKDGILSLLREKLTFASFPEGETKAKEDTFVDNVEYYYDYYNYMSQMYYGSVYFGSLDEAGCWYFGLGAGADWKAHAAEEALRVVQNTLLLTSIAKLEGITVSEEEAKDWVREIASANSTDPANVLAVYSVGYVYTSVVCEKVLPTLFGYTTFDYGELDLSAGK